MFGFRSLLPGFALLAFSAGATIAQDAAPSGTEVPAATLKLNVRTVLVDVVVMDKDGRAVPGLTKDDFQITENGAPQAIDFFEPHFASAPGAAPTAPPLAPNTFTNVPATPPNEAVNVLLMDAMNTPLADQAHVHKDMVGYLASIPPGIRIGIFLLSEKLRIIQGFTQDSAVLRASIARLAANPNFAQLLPSTAEMEADSNALSMTGGAGSPFTMALQDFLNEQTNFDRNQQLLITLDSLQTIARYLAGVPGRKNLIWFAGSFPACTPGVATSTLGCPFQEKYQKTIDMLAAARVSVYPIAAGGISAPNAGISGSSQGQSSPPTSAAGADVLHASLTGPSLPTGPFGDQSDFINRELWAEATGGKAFHGNDFKQELADAIADGSRYYTLAYAPSDRKEIGRERKIEVTAASGKYKLFYRRTYFEDTPKKLRAAEAAPA
ncbi:MAG: VWA domain-containing protein, partial [Terracidiphilus sp.]